MARLETGRGWGLIYDSETDQDVPTNTDGVDPEVAMRLADSYNSLSAVLKADESVGEDDETELDESDEPATYSESELEDMEWSELREMASDYDGEEVNGKSSKEDVVEFFAGREK